MLIPKDGYQEGMTKLEPVAPLKWKADTYTILWVTFSFARSLSEQYRIGWSDSWHFAVSRASKHKMQATGS